MRKIGFMTLLILASLLLAFAFPAAAAGPNGPVVPVAVTPVPAVPAAAAAMPEKHPHIEAALESMRAAKKQLEGAAHEFEGHRVKAIEHLDQAIREAEICNGMK